MFLKIIETGVPVLLMFGAIFAGSEVVSNVLLVAGLGWICSSDLDK